MTTESTCGSKFAQLVTYHVFSDVDRNKLVAIMYGESVTYKFGGYH